MKINASKLKTGDVIEVDCGYNGMIDMQPVTIISIGQCMDLWDNSKLVPHITVRTCNGEEFSLASDLIA